MKCENTMHYDITWCTLVQKRQKIAPQGRKCHDKVLQHMKLAQQSFNVRERKWQIKITAQHQTMIGVDGRRNNRLSLTNENNDENGEYRPTYSSLRQQ